MYGLCSAEKKNQILIRFMDRDDGKLNLSNSMRTVLDRIGITKKIHRAITQNQGEMIISYAKLTLRQIARRVAKKKPIRTKKKKQRVGDSGADSEVFNLFPPL